MTVLQKLRQEMFKRARELDCPGSLAIKSLLHWMRSPKFLEHTSLVLNQTSCEEFLVGQSFFLKVDICPSRRVLTYLSLHTLGFTAVSVSAQPPGTLCIEWSTRV